MVDDVTLSAWAETVSTTNFGEGYYLDRDIREPLNADERAEDNRKDYFLSRTYDLIQQRMTPRVFSSRRLNDRVTVSHARALTPSDMPRGMRVLVVGETRYRNKIGRFSSYIEYLLETLFMIISLYMDDPSMVDDASANLKLRKCKREILKVLIQNADLVIATEIREFVNLYIEERVKRCTGVPTNFRFSDFDDGQNGYNTD